MSKFKAGDKVKVVKYNDDNWYDSSSYLEQQYTVSACYSSYVSVLELNDEGIGFEPDHLELVEAASDVIEDKVTTTEDAIIQLASLLGDAFSDITISIQYDSVTVDWNNMGFVATDAKELEDICKAVTLLSGAKIGE